MSRASSFKNMFPSRVARVQLAEDKAELGYPKHEAIA
jgi:hypothetical protein